MGGGGGGCVMCVCTHNHPHAHSAHTCDAGSGSAMVSGPASGLPPITPRQLLDPHKQRYGCGGESVGFMCCVCVVCVCGVVVVVVPWCST